MAGQRNKGVEIGQASWSPTCVLIHVPDVELGLKWYQQAFPMSKVIHLPEFDFTVLDINGFSLEVVQADEKVSAGKSGTVLYWAVEDLHWALVHFQSLGAKLYRGPMEIDNGLSMCQVEDPFGNLIGLRGKLDRTSSVKDQ